MDIFYNLSHFVPTFCPTQGYMLRFLALTHHICVISGMLPPKSHINASFYMFFILQFGPPLCIIIPQHQLMGSYGRRSGMLWKCLFHLLSLNTRKKNCNTRGSNIPLVPLPHDWKWNKSKRDQKQWWGLKVVLVEWFKSWVDGRNQWKEYHPWFNDNPLFSKDHG
jgi:hypothetical protein